MNTRIGAFHQRRTFKIRKTISVRVRQSLARDPHRRSWARAAIAYEDAVYLRRSRIRLSVRDQAPATPLHLNYWSFNRTLLLPQPRMPFEHCPLLRAIQFAAIRNNVQWRSLRPGKVRRFKRSRGDRVTACPRKDDALRRKIERAVI
jgi:hypothetical protein